MWLSDTAFHEQRSCPGIRKAICQVYEIYFSVIDFKPIKVTFIHRRSSLCQFGWASQMAPRARAPNVFVRLGHDSCWTVGRVDEASRAFPIASIAFRWKEADSKTNSFDFVSQAGIFWPFLEALGSWVATAWEGFFSGKRLKLITMLPLTVYR